MDAADQVCRDDAGRVGGPQSGEGRPVCTCGVLLWKHLLLPLFQVWAQ